MGSLNQLRYLDGLPIPKDARILEVGSRNHGNNVNFRQLLPHSSYTGVDLTPGEGVDLVCDLTESTGTLEPAHFNLILCLSVLEHVKRPWCMADNLTELAAPNAVLYVVVPWVWRFHSYPDDYWRISLSGIKELFPAFDFTATRYSTNVKDDFLEHPEQCRDDKLVRKNGERQYLPYLQIHTLGIKR